MKLNKILAALAVALFGCGAAHGEVCSMRTDGEVNPVGIDMSCPRFSWQMKTDTLRHGQRQSAWQIVVADASTGAAMWNSGRRVDDRSVGIAYAGYPLQPETEYDWHLTVWDESEQPSHGSARFETGMLADGWEGARWIGAEGYVLPLYAPYLPVFGLDFTVQVSLQTGKGSILYGMNDFRLMNLDFNILGVNNDRDSLYVRVEFDASVLPAHINIYRAGYTLQDNPAVPVARIELPDSVVNASNRLLPHRFRLTSVLGTTRLYSGDSNAELGKVELNPMGVGGDFIAFPVVGDVAFMAPGKGSVHFSDVKLRHYRRPANVIHKIAADTVVRGGRIQSMPLGGMSLPMLRTEFRVKPGMKSARLYVTARGVYDLEVNGSKVAEQEYLNPGLTQYNRTHEYRIYDVTPMLHAGSNAIGAQLSEGWWSGAATFQGENWNVFGDRQSLLAKLVVTYDNGNREVFVTDPSTWDVYTRGPLRSGSLFQGEVFDAREAARQRGWSRAGFHSLAHGWRAAREVPLEGNVSLESHADMPPTDDYSQFTMRAARGATVMAVDTLTAQSVSEPRPGVYVYDMGVDFAGVPLVYLPQLPEGTEVAFRFAEVVYPDMSEYEGNAGMLMLENIRAAMARDVYIAAGSGREVFSPRSTSHGYRFVEITGIGAPLPVDSVKGIVLSSIDGFTAGYRCSDERVNRLWDNVERSMRANFMSIPTDCPQRNERLGWSGDISVFCPTATYMGDVSLFLRRHMQAMRDVQRGDGKFLDIAPIGNGFGGVLWGSAGIVLPWQCYVQYADTAMLSENYDAMCRYIDFIENHDIDPETGIIVQNRAWGDLTDWLGPEDHRNDKSLLWEAYFIHDLDIMAAAAQVLGKSADAERFAGKASARREFFNRTYIDAVTGKTVHSAFEPEKQGKLVDTQTSYVLPLAFDIVTDSLRDRFVDNFAASVSRSRDGFAPCSLLTGFIGTAWISRALSDAGHSDLAYRLLLNEQYPSWLYPVSQGATTVWERLDSYTHSNGFGGNNRMNSFNHYSFGAVAHWLMSRSIGIEVDPEHPGFSRFVLRPEIDLTGELTEASGHYDSPYGRIESAWHMTDDSVEYRFLVPANTTARLQLPGEPERMLSSGIHTITRPRF